MRDGDRLFSDPASTLGVRFPKQSYWYLHDLLGKKFTNPLVKHFQKRFPYYDMEADPETGTVLFKHDSETKYSPEELLAMILEKAKEAAEDFAEQPIKEAVITVPTFFNQAERRSVLRAGEMAGLKILQLMNDNTAVVLNYGVFRRKSFNSTPVHYMFFDMGASSTTATIVSYQVVKTKNAVTGIVDTFPQLTIKGVGYDRRLGGLEFALRLRDHLAEVFNAQKKTKTDVRTNTRAMAKLLKEANRVKHVLSANNEHYAQVEGLLDDQDFKARVTRAEVEAMCSDLFDRVGVVVKDVLKSSEITMGEITEVILMGGSTRMPKIQQKLREVIAREDLGKGINTDEAAAMGSVYQAAHLSKGFRVKKFAIKDANLFPIQVEFERVKLNPATGENETRIVKRTLFGRLNPYPQKKVMTFNKYTSDFGFTVSYGDLQSFLQPEDLEVFDNTVLQQVVLSGVGEAHSKHTEDSEPKGIKAHFRMDDSGVLTLDMVESVFEKPAPEENETDEESTFSKLSSKLSNLFGGGDAAKKEGEKTDKATEEGKTAEGSDDKAGEKPKDDAKTKKKEEAKESKDEVEKTKSEEAEKSTDKDKTKKEKKDESSDKKEEKKEEEKKEDKKTDKDDKTEPKEKKKPKAIVIKEEIKTSIELVDLKEPSLKKQEASKKMIEELRAKDIEKHLLAKAQNELESFTVEAQDKLYQEIYEKCSTEEEREKIRTAMSEASDWIYEQDEKTPIQAYKDKLIDLQLLTRDLYERVRELEERPKAQEAMKGMLNYTRHFLVSMRNYTGEDLPFTQVEYDTLAKLINSTVAWKKDMEKEQAKLPPTKKPVYLLEDVARKIADLDREVKYLLNKAKTYRPKEKPTNTTESADNSTKTGNNTKSDGVKLDIDSPPDDKSKEKTEEAAEDTDAADIEVEESNTGETMFLPTFLNRGLVACWETLFTLSMSCTILCHKLYNL
ncbi:hypothetical protein NP493_657g01042 [Ridgeia piscesae]|uniref:Hypoxia up-regulated protein 1 n=1 Tax=Ridgeia piscesae TaxID=27915 RepID=A0AAD9KRW5_RIDPI|nr:hypothetical protein NP493_657g01042 [Ridgeia piscesae]